MQILRVLKWLVVLALTVAVSIGAVVLLAAYDELTATLPPIDRLLEYDPPVATRVYADDGQLVSPSKATLRDVLRSAPQAWRL